MTGKHADTVMEFMDRIESLTLDRAWSGLTDAEFSWEPTPDAWSVRARTDCRTRNPFGAGDWVADHEFPVPIPPPLTTIAWLLWHIGSVPLRLTDIDFLGGTRSMASGWTSPYLAHHPVFTDAAAATLALRDGWEALRDVIRRTADEQFELHTARYTYADVPMKGGLRILGPPGAEHPATFFVAAVVHEISHHSTQICVLRDLFAARR